MKIIAEIGINHNGSVANAKQLILMAKDCGADYVKFQKRDIKVCYTAEYLDSNRESPWGSTQRAQKEALELSLQDYQEIDDFCKQVEIPWFASAWDIGSFEWLERFRPTINKIASPMLTNLPFVERVSRSNRLTLISTGMSTMDEIDKAAWQFEIRKCPFVLMHCVSEYPCEDGACNLGIIVILKNRYGCAVGYSNHSPGIESCIGAAYRGAEYIECHVTLDRAMYGSDQSASLERRGLELVVKYTKNAKTIIGDGVKVIRPAEKANISKLRYWENQKL